MKCPRAIIKIAEVSKEQLSTIQGIEKDMVRKEIGTVGASAGIGSLLVPLILKSFNKRDIAPAMSLGAVGGTAIALIINELLDKKRFDSSAGNRGYDVSRQKIPFGGGIETTLSKSKEKLWLVQRK